MHNGNPRPEVAQHVPLPEVLSEEWVRDVMLSPPNRAVVLDGMDCRDWNTGAVQMLALRLMDRGFEPVAVSADLLAVLKAFTFVLTEDAAS
jgi:hypothetical protein